MIGPLGYPCLVQVPANRGTVFGRARLLPSREHSVAWRFTARQEPRPPERGLFPYLWGAVLSTGGEGEIRIVRERCQPQSVLGRFHARGHVAPCLPGASLAEELAHAA